MTYEEAKIKFKTWHSANGKPCQSQRLAWVDTNLELSWLTPDGNRVIVLMGRAAAKELAERILARLEDE